MTENVPLHEALGHMDELADRAVNGEEVILTREGKPPVRLVPVNESGMPESDRIVAREPKRPIRFGLLKGKIWMADDFDAPLPDDLLKAFYGLEPDEPWPPQLDGKP
ncbi:type II toxin-antitoxin system prevent-host-death family antitoxin [Azospirillum sp.]|uniref:type II toxin-antitoxin system Phd/YefM family antitoxin n=1 Tax=Azospirillum sp. TaxID=34012 RepID=UPI002D6E5640|nr:type II toxin-antitoxin system prevent-host-death family antitoxin [Azospirillum sp.]HYD65625.1 type II toxin-antitoxin system prevent-host-death family antitoxin [Azospirillum sp.]